MDTLFGKILKTLKDYLIKFPHYIFIFVSWQDVYLWFLTSLFEFEKCNYISGDTLICSMHTEISLSICDFNLS